MVLMVLMVLMVGAVRQVILFFFFREFSGYIYVICAWSAIERHLIKRSWMNVEEKIFVVVVGRGKRGHFRTLHSD